MTYTLSLQLLHDYHLEASGASLTDRYDISNTLQLLPTAECARLLRCLRWTFRSTAYGAELFAQVEPVNANSFKTQLSVDRPYALTFWLVVKDAYFQNYT